MTTPFPGMDPYLEHPAIWPDVHNSLIAALRDSLNPTLRPKYYASLEERTYLAEPEGLLFVGRPDPGIVGTDSGGAATPNRAGDRAVAVEVPVPDRLRETYLVVHAVGSGDVVTVLEILSPTNKRPGEGRRAYEEKRMAVLGSRTSLVEIDLVRGGEPMTVFGATERSDYRILVSRGARRPRADLHPFSVRDPIPTFRLPLLPGDNEPEVDSGALLRALYDRASYDLRIDYRPDSVPPLGEADRAWADGLLRTAKKR